MAQQGVSVEEVTNAITAGVPAEQVFVRDVSSGCGAKFSILVVAKAFEDKKLLERQRTVNAALSELMPRIHAVQMKTWTEQQYQDKVAEGLDLDVLLA